MKNTKKRCCNCDQWLLNIKRNGNGEKWIKYMLTTQILYFISYNVVNYLNHKKQFVEFELFIILVLFWLACAAIIFFRNVVIHCKIGEMIPFTFSVLSINLYILSKMISTGIDLADRSVKVNGDYT